jgi:hypothetical protein
MSYPSQSVVYARSGEFSVPIEVLQEVFRRCPPDTEKGKAIFWARRKLPLPESTYTFFGPYVLFSSGEYVADLNTFDVFALKSYNQMALRTSPHFRQILEERGLFKTVFDIAEVPFGCTFHIEDVPLPQEGGGKEKVVVEVPWKSVIEDLYLMCKGGGKLGWNPLTLAMLEDKALAMKIIAK